MSEFRQALASALTAVDASLAWPDETTVSYAPDETELFASLAAVTSEAAPAEDTAPLQRGREIHVATRTLSGVAGQRTKHRSWAWVAGATLGLSATALVVVALGAPFFRRPDSDEVVLAAPAEPAQAALPEPRAIAGRGPELAEPPVAVTSDEPRAGHAGGHGTFAPTPRAIVRRAPPAASQSTPAASTTAEPRASKSARPPAVGANRSPIIE